MCIIVIYYYVRVCIFVDILIGMYIISINID